MTDLLDLAKMRRDWMIDRPPGRLGEKQFLQDIRALCDEIERLRAENAEAERLRRNAQEVSRVNESCLRNAMAEADAMRPVVEAARALYFAAQPYDGMQDYRVQRQRSALAAAVAAYESAQPNMGDALLNVSLEPKVVQPSPQISGATESACTSDKGSATPAAGDQRASRNEMYAIIGCPLCAERDATIARIRDGERALRLELSDVRGRAIALESDNTRLRAALTDAADNLNDAYVALFHADEGISLDQCMTVREWGDKARAAAKEGV